MPTQSRAVVIGASMAGLMVARVLVDEGAAVTIIDRDELPPGPSPRKGVPHGRHAHGLLASGERVLRDLFPGMMEELIAGGAQPVTAESGRWWQFGGYRTGAPAAPDAVFLSRPYLENGVRRRVMALPEVEIVRGSVRGLIAGAGRVAGVESEIDGANRHFPADLVVDTSGRGSQAARWLEALGYPTVPVSQVHIDMGYATRLMHRTPGRLPDATWIVVISDPAESKRFGVAFPIEGERWIVTLGGCHGDHAPTDETAFVAWAETLPTGDIADIFGHEAPVGPIITHRFPSSQWRHFEKVRSHPAGFVALGDAICSFNPVYGQGMSSAARQALALRVSLANTGWDSPDQPTRFYKAAAQVIANPWAIAVGGDFGYPETTGPKPPMVDAINRYVKKAVIAAQYDSDVATALFEVQNLMAPPPSLMNPPMFLKVRRSARRGPKGGARPFPASLPRS
jgi:2-polyprenyl-6-methoxyphenol hydroxylase-like FAD-dependent oxidoreductase